MFCRVDMRRLHLPTIAPDDGSFTTLRSFLNTRKVGSMRKQIFWLPVILMAVFGFAVVPARAQTVYGVRAEVPFDFIVGNNTLPAGKITVRRTNSGEAGPLEVINHSERQLTLRMGRRLTGTEATARGKLVFRRYGNKHYLAEVWIPGYKAIAVLKSKSERALENELRLAKNYRPMVVTVFATID